MTAVTTNVDPTSFKQAVKCQHWVEAMNCELEALERMEHKRPQHFHQENMLLVVDGCIK